MSATPPGVLWSNLHRDIATACYAAESLAWNLDRDLEGDLDPARASEVALDRVELLDSALGRAIDRARVLDRYLSPGRHLAFGLGFACDRARDRARDLADDLGSVSDLILADDLASVCELRLAFDSVLDSVSSAAIARAIARARTLHVIMTRTETRVLYLEGHRPSTPGLRSGARRSAAARRLAAAAARMLPAGDRARYGEEFGSELADLALAGGGRRVQLAYAARQLRRAPRLRADLRSPRRRSAAP
jgi:hypothetical protein